MKSTASLQGVVPTKRTEYRDQFLAQFDQYLATQHPIVRGLHLVLKGLAMICFALPFIFGIIAFYYTIVWALTGSFSSLGEATNLPIAWVNFGMSLLVPGLFLGAGRDAHAGVSHWRIPHVCLRSG